MPRWVAGVDGCRKGWIVALCDLTSPNGVRIFVETNFSAVVDEVGTESIIAVDIPIGLPARVQKGGCQAEQLVAPLLGDLKGTVFPTSARDVVYAGDYTAAIAQARALAQPFRIVNVDLAKLAEATA